MVGVSKLQKTNSTEYGFWITLQMKMREPVPRQVDKKPRVLRRRKFRLKCLS